MIIGNEVLDGITLDTNSNWLVRRLISLGASIKIRITIRDELDAISWAIHQLINEKCSIIFVSGGLGPTHDDLTLQGLAQALKMELEINPKALAIVERQYKWLYKKGFVDTPEITKPRKKMAMLPKNSTPLNNTVGGAPGVMIDHNKYQIFALPGVPAEFKAIYNEEIETILRKKHTRSYSEEVIEREVKDESMIAPIIDQIMIKYPNLWLKSLPPAYGTSTKIRFWFSHSSTKLDKDTLQKTINQAIEDFDCLLEATKL